MNHKSKRGANGYAAIAIVAFLVLPILYALSIGPLAWLQERGYISDAVAGRLGYIYMPLGLVVNNWVWARNIFEAYISWWTGVGP